MMDQFSSAQGAELTQKSQQTLGLACWADLAVAQSGIVEITRGTPLLARSRA
jgi:hypothetical protein